MSQFILPARASDANNNPLSGALVYFYASGTLNLLDVYTTSALTVAHPNPVVADAGGLLPAIYTNPALDYRAIVKTSAGVTIKDYDPYQALEFDSSDSTFIDDGTGAVSTTVRNFLRRINHKASGFFYEEAGAKVQRLRDRVFVGDAAAHLGTNAGSQPDWLTTFLLTKGRTFGFQHVAQMAVLQDSGNTAGGNAVVAAARTSPLTAAGGVIGVLGVAVNNNSTFSCGAWGGYFEGFQQSGALGPCYALEADPINFNAVANSTAYSQAANQVVGFQMAASGEFATGVFPISAAFALRKNGSTFDKGIIFGNDALTGTTGNGTGTGLAIQVACGHYFQQLTPTATIGAQMFFTGTTTAGSTTMTFAEGAALLTNSSTGKTLMQLISGSTRVNFFNMIPGATGEPITLGAAGDNANVGVLLSPKGTEYVWFGTFTANADAPVNGYITIKDAGGTLRKLATIA